MSEVRDELTDATNMTENPEDIEGGRVEDVPNDGITMRQS